MFPKRRMVSVGLGTWVETIRGEKINLWERLDNFIRHHPTASRKLQGSVVKLNQAHMIRCSQSVERICGDGFLLAGDAGGFVSAVGMEGIWYAMKTGEAAGRSVVRALEEGQSPQSITDTYPRTLPARVTEDMRYGLEIRKRYLDKEGQQERIVAALNRDKWFEQILAALINGFISHKRWMAKVLRRPDKLIKAKLMYR